MGHNTANCCEHEANKDKRPKNWKEKEDKEVGASNIEVLLGCTKRITIKCETEKILFEIDLSELALQKLDKIPVPNNPPDENENNMGNINIEEAKEGGVDGEKGSSGTKCCLRRLRSWEYQPEWLYCRSMQLYKKPG